MGFGQRSTPVAPVNSMTNATMSHVVGNKDDKTLAGPGNSSLYALSGYMGYYHVHGPAKAYPELAAPVTVTADAAAWTYGAWVEIVPDGAITEAFDIHWVHSGEVSAQGNYVLQIAKGDAGSEEAIGTIAFSRDSNQVQTASQPIQIPPQFAGTRISCRVASDNAVADTVDVKVYYHEYPV